MNGRLVCSNSLPNQEAALDATFAADQRADALQDHRSQALQAIIVFHDSEIRAWRILIQQKRNNCVALEIEIEVLEGAEHSESKVFGLDCLRRKLRLQQQAIVHLSDQAEARVLLMEELEAMR